MRANELPGSDSPLKEGDDTASLPFNHDDGEDGKVCLESSRPPRVELAHFIVSPWLSDQSRFIFFLLGVRSTDCRNHGLRIRPIRASRKPPKGKKQNIGLDLEIWGLRILNIPDLLLFLSSFAEGVKYSCLSISESVVQVFALQIFSNMRRDSTFALSHCTGTNYWGEHY